MIAQVYSVSQLNLAAKNLLNQHFFSIQVEGEVSNLSTPASGHCYFSLKDNQAQIRCALFRQQKRGLNFKLENGCQVVVSAQLSVYEARGDYQLIATAVELAGDGELLREFEQLKTRLCAEGLFDERYKQALPYLPQTIGVISSATGAAFQDILAVLKRRFAAIKIIIYPVSVQGHQAKFEIVKAIETANQRQDCQLLLMARGGGSLEDLWAFNEEIVARAIFASQLPIVSAIGHETDVTIADFVADIRAATPSAAAERLSPDKKELLSQFQHLVKQLSLHTQQLFKRQQTKIDSLQQRLNQQHPQQQLIEKAQRLDEWQGRLELAMQTKLSQLKAQSATDTAKLWQYHPQHQLQSFKVQLAHLQQSLTLKMQQCLKQYRQQVANNSQLLQTVSPLATLARGYAMVTPQNQTTIISSSKQLKQGDFVETRLAHGRIISQVKELSND